MTVLMALQLGNQSAETLAARCEMSERQLRLEVNTLRKQGYAIISGDSGYHLSNDMAEIRACCARIRTHAISELEIANAMEKRARLLGDAVQLEAI